MRATERVKSSREFTSHDCYTTPIPSGHFTTSFIMLAKTDLNHNYLMLFLMIIATDSRTRNFITQLKKHCYALSLEPACHKDTERLITNYWAQCILPYLLSINQQSAGFFEGEFQQQHWVNKRSSCPKPPSDFQYSTQQIALFYAKILIG